MFGEGVIIISCIRARPRVSHRPGMKEKEERRAKPHRGGQELASVGNRLGGLSASQPRITEEASSAAALILSR